MALLLTVQTPFGVDATYWKICVQEIDWLARKCTLQLYGWANKVSRDNKFQPLHKVTFTWENDMFPFTVGGNNLQEAYGNCKMPLLDEQGNNVNPFVDALDDI